uniref:Uncharacterized protein n=1 Tax=Aegilops tauschii subsp. strangulata TaxID=200361 RepID=A0A453SD04_AEGTS
RGWEVGEVQFLFFGGGGLSAAGMGDSGGSVVSIDVERISFGGKEHHIETKHGPVSVAVYGDHDKHALITYPDVALNHMSCFQGLLFCPEAASLLLHNFCIYHISPPGHELGATPILPNSPVASVDELADQVAEVLDFFGLGSVMCLGVSAGAYILTLFAVCVSLEVIYFLLVALLIVISTVCCRQSIGSVCSVLSSFHLYVELPHGLSGFIIR